jgi:hypothetical protein
MLVSPEGKDEISFRGSAQGRIITLEPGEYQTGERIPNAQGLFLDPHITPECESSLSGPIQAGEMRTCTWTNTYSPEPP